MYNKRLLRMYTIRFLWHMYNEILLYTLQNFHDIYVFCTIIKELHHTCETEKVEYWHNMQLLLLKKTFLKKMSKIIY